MSLLSDIKFFARKYLKNPILIAALAYIVYRFVTKYVHKESFAESIKIIKVSSNYSIIFDSKVNKYILISKNDNKVLSADSADELNKYIR